MRLSNLTTQKAVQGYPVFSAHKNSVDQTGVADGTKITFSTEEYDTHNCFDTTNSRFQPNVAGKYLINISVQLTSAVANSVYWGRLYKNGAAYKVFDQKHTSGLYAFQLTGSILVDFNGTTDYVEINIGLGPGGTTTISGGSGATYFQGHRVG